MAVGADAYIICLTLLEKIHVLLLALSQVRNGGGQGKAGGNDGRIGLILPAAVGCAVDFNGQVRVI